MKHVSAVVAGAEVGVSARGGARHGFARSPRPRGADLFIKREKAFGHQLPPDLDRIGVIDREDANGRTADWGQADQLRSTPQEVIHPPIATRMKEPDNLTFTDAGSSYVRSVVPVESRSHDPQVIALRPFALLASEDVIEGKDEPVGRLGKMTVFTPSPCSRPHSPDEVRADAHGIHDEGLAGSKARRAWDRRMAKWSATAMYSSSSSRSGTVSEPAWAFSEEAGSF